MIVILNGPSSSGKTTLSRALQRIWPKPLYYFSYDSVDWHIAPFSLLDTAPEEKFADPEMASMRNVAGEIRGAQAAMEYALAQGWRGIVICHDYAGIANWCTGEWKASKEGTAAYRDFYRSIKDRLEVRFVKVKGHSHDRYNDMADELAKEALGIE